MDLFACVQAYFYYSPSFHLKNVKASFRKLSTSKISLFQKVPEKMGK